jgi:hypothetical protein
MTRLLGSYHNSRLAINERLRHLGKDHPLRQARDEDSFDVRRLAQLRILLTYPPDAWTFELMGLLLSDTRHHRRALLFLAAAARTAEVQPDLRRSRAKVLRKLSLHRLAYDLLRFPGRPSVQ